MHYFFHISTLHMKIFLIHGFMANATLNFFLLSRRLKNKGFRDLHTLSYSSFTMDLETATQSCYKQILDTLHENRVTEPIILLGNSIGGVIAYNLLNTDLNVRLLIMIASPIKGCRLIDGMWDSVKSTIRHLAPVPILRDLCNKEDRSIIEPSVPYYTITSSLPSDDHYDGTIHRDDAVIDEKRNFHIPKCSHTFLAVDKRCAEAVLGMLKIEGIVSTL